MKRISATALFALSLAIGPAIAESKTSTIVPGNVVRVDPKLTRSSNPQLTGSFRFIEDAASGIESNLAGGACLIADLTGQGIGEKHCRTDDDCNGATFENKNVLTPGRKILPANYEGYCVMSVNAPRPSGGVPTADNKCWVRPGTHGSHCTSSRTLASALKTSTYRLPRVPADPTGAGLPVAWRIHSCLNGISGESEPPPCSVRADPRKEQNNGPIFTYRPAGK
jgi:hypothetical protein